MIPSDGTRPTNTRRRFLGGVAGMTAAGLVPAVTTAATSPVVTATVLTRNVSLGVDLSKLLGVNSLDGLRRVASEFRDQVDPELYAARADAIAAEVEATGADVVALQEAGTVRAANADSDDGGARDERIDFLERITGALSDRDLDYEAAAKTVTTELELTAATERGRFDLRVADRDALLVRGDIDVGDTTSDRYDATEQVRLLGGLRTVTLRRGFCAGDVTVDGVEFTAVSTHLESVSESVRRRQAGELLDQVPSDRPVVLAGDFNSGPGGSTATYDRLTRSFEDGVAVQRPDAEGFTCCQAPDLRNEQSRLDRRIDAVLYRGDVRPASVERVGHERSDRVEVTVDGESFRVWPSDHAGVAVTVRVTGSTPESNRSVTTESSGTVLRSVDGRTVTGTATADRLGTDTGRGTSRSSGPGAGVLATLAGIGGGIVTALRQGRTDEQ